VRLVEDAGGFGTLLVIGHEWLPLDAWPRSTAWTFARVTTEEGPGGGWGRAGGRTR
jgi:hypothetical protein